MKNLSKNMFDILLAKYLEGSATEQESAEVELWIAESSENKQVFEQFQNIWTKSQGVEFDSKINFDKKAAFQKVLTRIDNQSNKEEQQINQSNQPIKFLTFFTRIAAVLIIGVGIYFSYRYYQQKKSEVLLADTNNTEFLTFDSPFLTLPDSSTINLNAGGELKYASKFMDNRSLSLTGEAFFEVKNKNNTPFVVEASDIEVKVLGTSFYIKANKNDSLIEVGVKTGKVQVSQKSTQKSLILTENESLIYNKNSQSFGIVETLNTNELYWLTGVLEFNEQPLDQVLSTLSKVYETKIVFNRSSLESCNFTGRFKNAELEEIIEQLKISFAIEVAVGEQITITGQACK